MTKSDMQLYVVFLIVSIIFSGTAKADLASDVKLLKARVEELEKFKATQTTYCNLHASGKCGPCICKDDFNLPEKFYCDCRNQPAKRDCLEFYQSGYRVDGIYKITLNGFKTINVFCDQTFYRNGKYGGWTVIQRRMDGSTNFYRNWQQYKDGFGELQREFWLGNDNIHLLTAQAIYPSGSEAIVKLRTLGPAAINYIDCFNHFQVDNENSKYMLHVSSIYQHHLLAYNNNQLFSTYDRDNDGAPSYNCAKDYNFGGWWYNGKGNTCTSVHAAYTNYNGPYDEDRVINTWYKTMNVGTAKLEYATIIVRRI